MSQYTDGIVFDELSDLTEKQWRAFRRLGRQSRAKDGWPNWYINRGRLPLNPTKADLRRVSWRRAK